ncbi:hybrid sensor histidine kinase/response regulator [Oceanicella actignis]|uniref:hybrid sensor histidine kinase/response regulator n=1 Tax=Oceanicella actignis TaxID=1189325 RepID=UPI001252B3CD|nr:ATP-binding protein [Oceanicella actignis]TYO89967.1 two-component system cell cycle sensor histidine kinase/response regulator CckA [Oceanicella actignis]
MFTPEDGEGAPRRGLLATVAAATLPARRADRTRAAFDALFADNPQPAALTDDDGAILAANGAFEAAFGPGAGMLDERLAAADPAAQTLARRVVYRLLRAALRERRAATDTLPHGGAVWEAEAAPAAGGALWRLRPASEGGAGDLAIAGGFGVARESNGRVIVNRCLAEMVEGPVQRLEDLFETFPERPGQTVRLARPRKPGARVRVFFDAARRGADAPRVWLVQPVCEDEPEADGGEDLLEHLPVALARLRPDGTLVSANAPARRLLGPGATPGARLDALVEGLGRPVSARIREAAAGRSSGRAEMARGRDPDREVFLQLSLTRVTFEGEPALIAVLSDATELKTLEAQFVQSQKMQAVGQLAGGVAHDFNNLLTAINGHCDLLLMRRDTNDPDHADLMQIRQNANRAAALVRQMLAFSRKQTLRPRVISLVDTLTELSHMLNRLLGERVRLHLEHEGEIGRVRVDERQFEQVIMNLVVNARDAMPEGGDVRIRTRNVTVSEEFRRDRAAVPAGEYVLIEVSDTGQGIPPDKIGKIFEPFFTTKKPGEGTGLGLSTAYGIVKQTGGFIFADSAPGQGATFSIYLPRLDEEAEEPDQPAAASPAPDLGGEGVVLLAEDEAPVRSFAARALRLRGYEVIEADSAEAALEIVREPGRRIDLVVSDVVMPGMDGPSWIRIARRTRPDLRVIFVSGYAEDAFRRSLDDLTDFSYLPKPFTLNELSKAVKDALTGAPAGG